MSRQSRDPRESLETTVTTEQLRGVLCAIGDALLRNQNSRMRERATTYVAALFSRLYETDRAIWGATEPVRTSTAAWLTWEDTLPVQAPGTFLAKDFLETTRKEAASPENEGGYAPPDEQDRLGHRLERRSAMDTIDVWIARELGRPQAS